jgi:hypothetical protein
VATYAVQTPPHAGAAITFTSPPASGDVAPCGVGYALLIIAPAANGTVTVALTTPSEDGLTVQSRTVTMPQATPGPAWLIPLPPSVYGGSTVLTYTGTLTTVQAAVISSPAS